MADLSEVDQARADAAEVYRVAHQRGVAHVDALELAVTAAFAFGREVGAGDMERIEREARADAFEEAAAIMLRRANQIREGDPE